MIIKTIVKSIILFLAMGLSPLYAQSLQRPVIWAGESDRAEMLSRIDQYSWASSVVSQAKSIVDGKVNTHQSNPSSILNTIPAFAADDNVGESDAASANGGHAKVMNYASYSAMLYYITNEEKYAQFSADIISYYIDAMVDVPVDKMATSGSYFYDARTSYGHFAIAYDFIYNFLTKTGTQVYVKSTGQKVDFDNVKAQKMIAKLASNALQEHSGPDTHGKTVSNHPILRAPGTLFCILAVDDDTERERLFKVFWETGTRNQNSFKNTILPMFGSQGIWPESLSYSFMPGVTMVLNIIDRIKPEMNVFEENKHILEGNFLFDYLRMPSRYFVRFGDSKRKIDQTGTLLRYTLDVASRRGYTDLEKKAKVALSQGYNASGGYKPSVSTSSFNGFAAFPHLFWGVPVPSQVDGSIDFDKPTVIIEHAGIALQRNYVEENNKKYGLCGIIGGAHYVHSHVTGIAMELYGQGYVMGPNGGLSASLAERSLPVHTDYFRLYAGNNTVIVNGTSHGLQPGSWKGDAYVWMNTTKNIAAEPAHLEDAISTKFSFATQFLDDNVNNCDQQRTLSTIRTSETTAYYFDMFRSKSLTENKFHDYIYHNIGDEMHIMDVDNRSLDLTPTSKYQTYYNDGVKSPGWRFFENTEHTDPTDNAVNVRFDLNEFGKYMHVLTPAGVERQYTKALGPASREGEGSYLNKKTPILAIRQQGEAWDAPFVHIFEPSSSSSSSVKKVEHLYNGDVIIGVKVSSEIGNKTVEDYILCLPNANNSMTLPNVGISFTGRFAVVRYEQDLDKSYTTLYIGEGHRLSYGNFNLLAGDDKKGVMVVEGEPYFGRQLIFKNLNNNDVIPKGSTLSIEAIVGEEYVEATLWGNDTINLGLKTEAPYLWSDHPFLINMQDDTYSFTLRAKDAQGIVEVEKIIIETPGQEPYTDDANPHPVPGRIQFEDYDLGGQNLGYYDGSVQDLDEYEYRDSDLVDLGRNGTVVSSLEAEEWLEYTIDVEQSGFYKLSVRHNTTEIPSVSAFSVIQANDRDTLIHKFEALYTGRSAYVLDAVGQFFLKQGEQVLRFSVLNSGFNLDYMELDLVSSAYRVLVESPNGKVDVSPEQDYYAKNDEVTITATPDKGFAFKSWSGDYISTNNPITLQIGDTNTSIKANFEKVSALNSSTIKSLEVYPNPSDGYFTITLSDGMSATYKVYDLNGSLRSSGHFISQTKLKLEEINKGVYLLEIMTPQSADVRRLVIQ